MKKYIIILLFIVLIFNGFGNLREITDLAIVKAIGLDIDENGEYIANVIVLDTTTEEKNEGIIYEATGSSVQEAVRNVVDKSPKKLYLAHMETLIVSEQIAKEKLKDTLDFFIRDNEGSNNFFLLIARDCKAKDTIEVIAKEKVSVKELLLASVKYKGNGNTKTLNDNIKDILKKGKDICINVCSTSEDQIIMEDMAYLKGWTMQGYLTEDESVIFNLLENSIENAIITVGSQKDLVVAEIIDSNTKIGYKDGIIKVNIEIELNISEMGENVQLQTDEQILNVTDKIKGEIKEKTDELIYNCREIYDVDIIGFENLLYRKKAEYSKNIDIETEVDVKILNQGGVIRKW